VNVAREALNNRSIVINDVWLGKFKFGNEFWDVVNFSLVKDARANFLQWKLEGFPLTGYQFSTYSEPHRLVAVITTFFKLGTILELFFYWELEQLFANGKLAINILL
jgi:hypothetical protein